MLHCNQTKMSIEVNQSYLTWYIANTIKLSDRKLLYQLDYVNELNVWLPHIR